MRPLPLRELPARDRLPLHHLDRRAQKSCRFTGVEPVVRQSSPGARRSFCRNCGSPVAFESERWPDETHLYAALLEHPEDAAPQFHVHVAEKLPWIKLDDGLPQYERSAS